MTDDRVSTDFERLLSNLPGGEHQVPPLERWRPELSGDIDMLITPDGRWVHEGQEIQRAPLVQLFSRILWREGDEYFLKTPVEKWRIKVADAPFFVNSVLIEGRGKHQQLVFSCATGDRVVADRAHTLRLEYDDTTGEPRPYLGIRFGMEGLLSRSVYMQLVEHVREEIREDGTFWMIDSVGEAFELGREDGIGNTSEL